MEGKPPHALPWARVKQTLVRVDCGKTIQLSTFEDLMGSLSDSWTRQRPASQVKGPPRSREMEGFHRQPQDGTGWGSWRRGRKPVSGKVILVWGEEWAGLTMWVTSFDLEGKEGPLGQVSSPMWTRKFLTGLVSLHLEGRVELQPA